MTEQPRTGGDDAPNGYQPPSYIPSQGPDIPPPAPPAPPQYGQPTPFAQPGDQYGQQPGPYAQPYAQPYGQPTYYGGPAEPKGLSIASLCCGISVYVGFGFFILPQIAAVILGHMALKKEPSGKGMAIAGLVMGYLGIVLTAVVIIIIAIAMQVAMQNSGERF
jgi:hypothetical protein